LETGKKPGSGADTRGEFQEKVTGVLPENSQGELPEDSEAPETEMEELADSLFNHFQKLLEELFSSTDPPDSDDPRRKQKLRKNRRMYDPEGEDVPETSQRKNRKKLSTSELQGQIAQAELYSAKIYLRFPRAGQEEVYLYTGFSAPWKTENSIKLHGIPWNKWSHPERTPKKTVFFQLAQPTDSPPLNVAETPAELQYGNERKENEENPQVQENFGISVQENFGSSAKKSSNTLRIKTYQFGVRMIRLFQYLQRKREYTISSQIVRSGTSIGANVHEASKSESRADFIHKLMIAHKEMRETVFWLRLLKRGNYLPRGGYRSLRDDVDEIERILGKAIYTARKGKG
jgi:four helix bundle protein